LYMTNHGKLGQKLSPFGWAARFIWGSIDKMRKPVHLELRGYRRSAPIGDVKNAVVRVSSHRSDILMIVVAGSLADILRDLCGSRDMSSCSDDDTFSRGDLIMC
jgi:hypothetical protein